MKYLMRRIATALLPRTLSVITAVLNGHFGRSKSSGQGVVRDVWPIPSHLKLHLRHIPLGDFIFSIQELTRIGDYATAQQELAKALADQRRGTSRTSRHVRAYLLMMDGIIQRKAGRLSDACQTLQEASELFDQHSDHNGTVRCALALGDAYRMIGATDRSDTHLAVQCARHHYLTAVNQLQVLDDTPDSSDPVLSAQACWALAKLDLSEDSASTETLQYLIVAWRIATKCRNLWAQEECAQIIGRYYVHVGWSSGAARWLRYSLWCSLQIGSVERIAETGYWLLRHTVVRATTYAGNVLSAFRLTSSALRRKMVVDPTQEALRLQLDDLLLAGMQASSP